MLSFGSDAGYSCVVLEPGNFRRLSEGKPIVIKLGALMGPRAEGLSLTICYTPDLPWVEQQVGSSRDPLVIFRAIEDSLARSPAGLLTKDEFERLRAREASLKELLGFQGVNFK